MDPSGFRGAGATMGQASALARSLRAAGAAAVVARTVTLDGFGGQRPGALAVIGPDGGLDQILHGCLARELRAAADQLVRSPRQAVTTTCTVGTRTAAEFGLESGGTVGLFLQRLETLPDLFWDDGRGIARSSATLLEGAHAGATLTVTQFGELSGTLGDAELDADAHRHAASLMLWSTGGASTVEDRRGRLLVHVVWSTPRLVVVGAGPLADALVRVATAMGWPAHVLADPADAVATVRAATPADAVVVLSHVPAVDGPVLRAALASPAGYVGALGSRRIQAGRRHRLQAAGATDAELGRLLGPAGLDLGAAGPAEVALSIVAEIVAARAGRRGRPLTGTDDPIRVRPGDPGAEATSGADRSAGDPP